MGRLIDADALQEKWCTEMCRKMPGCEEDCAFWNYIHLAPTIKADDEEESYEEHKVGMWIRGSYWSEGCGMGETYGYYYKCSECGEVVKNDYNKCSYNFCPNCKAIMKGTKNEI
jgi:hypothetical protein